MRHKAIFVSTTRQAAEYWVRQWGYNIREVYILTPDTASRVHGLSKELPVYICGPTPDTYSEEEAMWEIVKYLQLMGNTIMDAQEMGNEYRLTLG